MHKRFSILDVDIPVRQSSWRAGRVMVNILWYAQHLFEILRGYK